MGLGTMAQYIAQNPYRPTFATPPVPTGAYGSMFSFNPEGLSADYQSKYNEAKGANESRYAQGMQGYTDRYNRGMSTLNGMGDSELADIRQRGEAAKGANSQKMQSLGLGGTTVGSTLNSGVDTQTNADLGRAGERIRQQRLSTDASLSGDTLGFMERRNDPYPDMGAYASMMMGMGRAGGAGAMPGGAYGAGAGGMAGGDNGMLSAPIRSGGSQILGDQSGAAQQVFTRQPGGGMSQVSRTPAEMQLAKNPMYLDSAPAGSFNQGAGTSGSGISSRYGAPALPWNGAGAWMMPKRYLEG